MAIAIQRRRARTAAVAEPGARPLLFLDVEGVILLPPFARGLPPGRVRTAASGLRYVPDRVGGLVRELSQRFDIVWTSGWEHHANDELLGILGLPEELPTLTFGRKARPGSSKWKIKPVAAHAGHRPTAWLDDHFVGRHERWAAHRADPTLLVRVDSNVGLEPRHVERLLRWADRVAPPVATEPRRSPNGGAPTPNGAVRADGAGRANGHSQPNGRGDRRRWRPPSRG
jgi:hypothetical protein